MTALDFLREEHMRNKRVFLKWLGFKGKFLPTE
jgi:hypothetical protein